MPITRFIPILGILTIIAVAALLSKNRRAIPWRTIAVGLGLQFLVALFVLRTGFGFHLMSVISGAFVKVLNCSFAGSEFVFGDLGKHQSSLGFVFAFQALPMIIFVATLMSILYYLRIIPMLVLLTGRAMAKLLGTSGAESLEVAASILMGQTEAPLVIRPYLKDLTESELMTVMTAGMAHIAGSVFGAYVLFGAEPRHLLTSVVMTAPGTIVHIQAADPGNRPPVVFRRGQALGRGTGPSISWMQPHAACLTDSFGAQCRGNVDCVCCLDLFGQSRTGHFSHILANSAGISAGSGGVVIGNSLEGCCHRRQSVGNKSRRQ